MAYSEDTQLELNWVLITKGPGTNALMEAEPGTLLTFSGKRLFGNGSSYSGAKLELMDKKHLGGDDWVLWFNVERYPYYSNRMFYNSHDRVGISKECASVMYVRELEPEEKAGLTGWRRTVRLPTWSLWAAGAVVGVLFLIARFV